MVKGLRDLKELPLENVLDTLQGELRPYQQLGMSWLFLRKYGFGGCLADDMGLGKNRCNFLSFKSKRNGINRTVVLFASFFRCPGNWQKEFGTLLTRSFGSSSLRLESIKSRGFYEKKAEEVDVVLTSYGLTVSRFRRVSRSSVSIDEAQNIKNSATKQSRAVRKLKGCHHISLTGTPMENRLSDIWSIFDFITNEPTSEVSVSFKSDLFCRLNETTRRIGFISSKR